MGWGGWESHKLRNYAGRAFCKLIWYGDERSYLHGLNRVIHRFVDIEMDSHSYAAFLRFVEGLRNTHELFMVGDKKRSTTKNLPQSQGSCPKLAHPCLSACLGCCTQSQIPTVMTVTKMMPSRHPIPVTVGTVEIAKSKKKDSYGHFARSWPSLPLPEHTMGGAMNARHLTIHRDHMSIIIGMHSTNPFSSSRKSPKPTNR